MNYCIEEAIQLCEECSENEAMYICKQWNLRLCDYCATLHNCWDEDRDD